MALYIRLSSRCRCARAQYVLAHRETERERVQEHLMYSCAKTSNPSAMQCDIKSYICF